MGNVWQKYAKGTELTREIQLTEWSMQQQETRLTGPLDQYKYRVIFVLVLGFICTLRLLQLDNNNIYMYSKMWDTCN